MLKWFVGLIDLEQYTARVKKPYVKTLLWRWVIVWTIISACIASYVVPHTYNWDNKFDAFTVAMHIERKNYTKCNIKSKQTSI